MKNVLFITNGHGEDLVAAEIIKTLGPKFKIGVLPVVGQGKAFAHHKVKILSPVKELPSGGFSLRNLGYLAKDLYAGLLGNSLEKLKVLRELKGYFDLIVAVGDIVPLIGALIVKGPLVFVGVNKSSYYQRFGYNYTPWEKFILRRHAQKVFVRDKLTEQVLNTRGIKVPVAKYVGNPLMDCFKKFPAKEKDALSSKVVGFLPGTREDAKINIEDFELVCEEIVKIKKNDIKFEFLIATQIKAIPEYMESKPFGQVLAEADLIIGLSGTGNEQAAGSGVPVISFYGRGSQYNQNFAEAQKQLLGNALFLVRYNDPISVAAEVWQLLRNPEKMKLMAEAGKERMGEAGAVERIAKYIKDFLL
jgi:hypothetical protein